MIAAVFASAAAVRLAPEVWAAAETRLTAEASEYPPAELRSWSPALVEVLDLDQDLANLVLPCCACHRLIHHTDHRSAPRRSARVRTPRLDRPTAETPAPPRDVA